MVVGLSDYKTCFLQGRENGAAEMLTFFGVAINGITCGSVTNLREVDVGVLKGRQNNPRYFSFVAHVDPLLTITLQEPKRTREAAVKHANVRSCVPPQLSESTAPPSP